MLYASCWTLITPTMAVVIVIGEATSWGLSQAERGWIVRELARRVYEHAYGSQR